MTGYTPVRKATFDKLQLDEGIFLENFDYSAIKTVEALKAAIAEAIQAGTGLLGATRGGGSFEATPTVRQIEVDGLRYPIVGSTRIDMWTIKLRGTLVEITPENFDRVLATSEIAPGDGMTKLKLRTDVQEGDYIKSLCWIGATSKGAMLIKLDNALNINGATFTFTDKGEGTLPFEFQAHLSDVEAQEYAPVEIIFLDGAAAAAANTEPKE